MSRVDEIRERLEAATPKGALNVVDGRTLCHIETDLDNPAGAGIGICSVPRKYREMALLFMYAPEDISYLLGRVEKLEGLLNRLVDAFDDPELDTVDREGFAEEIAIEARTLLADKSKENEHAK